MPDSRERILSSLRQSLQTARLPPLPGGQAQWPATEPPSAGAPRPPAELAEQFA
ncbi:MAG: hypothetical protein JNK29_10760, partial [Anaerolineales bacterium]|nr:hypothetical protein [Anaerolineales bacterium]